MECAICKKKIKETNSYGRYAFLVCFPCYEELHTYYGDKTLDFICDIGYMIEKKRGMKK